MGGPQTQIPDSSPAQLDQDPAGQECQAQLDQDSAGQECPAQLDQDSAGQECPAQLDQDSAGQECPAQLDQDSAGQECPAQLDQDSAGQECPAQLDQDSAGQECPAQLDEDSAGQECPVHILLRPTLDRRSANECAWFPKVLSLRKSERIACGGFEGAQCRGVVAMFNRRLLYFCLLLVFHASYLLFGGLVFYTLEQPHEKELRRKVEIMWIDFLGAHPCLSEEMLEDFLRKALVAKSFGVSALRNASGYENKWDFVSSIFFSGTTLTTIGYGHPFPISWGGKVFCLIYSMMGIPLTFSILSITAQNLCLLFHDRPIRSVQVHFNVSRNKVAWIHSSLLILTIFALFFLIPAVLFDLVEGDWEYLDALYFCFISLTTIGLGDFVPGEQSGQRMPALYKLMVTCYLLVGLAAVLLAVESVKSLVNWNRVFSWFLLGYEDVSRDEEAEPVLAGDLEVSFVQRPEETTRRRVPHSLSPNAEKSYGSLSPSLN